MLREYSLDTGALTINAAIGAEPGPPLILLHGVTSRWQTWLPVMPSLALRWRLHALDLRGHGRSARAAGAYRIDEYADDVIAILRRRIGAPAVIVGHSLGAIIATAVAARAPELVSAVVLEDPPLAAFRHESLRDRPEHASFRATRDLASAGLGEEALVARALAMRPESDVAATRAWARSIRQLDPDVLTLVLDDRAKEGYDEDACLRRIAAPTLLLQGEPALGGALNDADAGHAASLLTRGSHVKLAQLGHGIHAGDPALFCRLVHDFLEAL